MKTCTVAELLNSNTLQYVAIIHGHGDSYPALHKRTTKKLVCDLVKAIQEVNPATVITINPMSPDSSMGAIETQTQLILTTATVVLFIANGDIKISKWDGHISRKGDLVSI